jgi:hypothetical protein
MLQVENLTRQTLLIKQGRVADNFWTKFRGLMGVRQLPEGDGLLITKCDNVHTHFMRMPIDVFYINQHNCIIDIDPAMQTWRIGRKRSAAAFVIEAPSGTAQRTGSQVGDHLKISTG